MLRYYPTRNRKLCLFVGPQFSYLVTAKLYPADRTSSKDQKKSVNLLKGDNKPNRIDVGLVMGWDFEWKGFIFGSCGSFGFLEVSKGPEYKGKTVVGQLILGYNFAPLLIKS